MQAGGNSERIAVTGCGLVSSLGLDVANGCAAARAGMSRASAFEVYPVRSSADGEAGGVVCHAVPYLTEGFEGDARLTRLLQGGLEDLLKQCPHAPWNKKRAFFYLSAPPVNRLVGGAELVDDEESRNNMLEAGKEASKPNGDLERAGRFLEASASAARWTGRPEVKWCTQSGHTGVAEAIEQASRDLARGICDIAIVGGVDSLLDEDTLGWLELTGRLKTPDLATGLQPAEACGFLILQTERTATAMGIRIQARLQAVYKAQERNSLFSGEPSTGMALAEVLSQALPDQTSWLVHDLNGEQYRASEWGNAIFRLASSLALQPSAAWLPSTSFGDTGAATGVVQACWAIQALERKYAPAVSVALSATSEDALRTCVVLTRN